MAPTPLRTDTTGPDVVVLDGSPVDGDRLALLGGKGAALERMISAELPVPGTAVITTNAFRRASEGGRLAELIDTIRQHPTEAPLDDSSLDAAFVESAFDDALRDQILAARRRIAPGEAVAIRSSATTEDLGGASFAGQYVSLIGLESDDEILNAVSRVWASLWHHAPHTYRRLHGIDGDVAMAVVLQAMVPAVRAGVVFTIDPGGAPGHLRIEDVEGFGEALVSGAVTPTARVLPRDHLTSATSGVDAAVRLALESEEVFGCPQDVEWADDGEHVWLVQSRPITTVATAADTPGRLDGDDGFNTDVGTHRRFTTAGIGEMLPGVFPVLSWATAGFMVEEAFRHAIDELGALPPTLVTANGFVVRLRGRAALDLDHMGEVADTLPGGSADELEHQYFGVGTGNGKATKAPFLDRVRHDVRVLAAHRSARREQAMTNEAIEMVLATDVTHAELTDRELLALRGRLVDLGVRSTIAEFSIAAAAVAAHGRLEDALRKHLGDMEGARWARELTRHLPPTYVLRTTAELAARLDHTGIDLRDCDSWEEACETLRATDEEQLASDIPAAAERAGCQRVVGGTCWIEDLDRFWHLVRDSPRHQQTGDLRSDMAALEGALVSLPGWTRTRVLTGQFLDIRRHLVKRLVGDALDLLERREIAKSAVLALGGRIRRIDLELGARLASRGLLFHQLDVEHVHPLELEAALKSGIGPGLDVVLDRRRQIERWEAEDELPMTFTGQPPSTPMETPEGDRFDGWGASPGRHTGPVRFLATPDERAVQPGDVVVAQRTDASWSPVFVRAAAIVVEQGGPLSHAAIVARELGLPGVVNVPGVVARLRHESSPVTVDGDLGAVFVNSPEGVTAQ